VDNSKKTGRGNMVRPDFFNEINEIIGSSHTVHPQHVTDSAEVGRHEIVTSQQQNLPVVHLLYMIT